MLDQIANQARVSLRKMEEDDSGAILLAALAGCLILFMLSLVLYDAGNASREKVRLQTATDSAAYSQAAIKARTLNTNAYTNVAKRSILGLQVTYHTSFSLFFSHSKTAMLVCMNDSDPSACAFAIGARTNCAGGAGATGGGGPGAASSIPDCANWPIAHFENTGDWDDLDPGIGNNKAVGGYTEVRPVSGVASQAAIPNTTGYSIPGSTQVKVGGFRVIASKADKPNERMTGVMNKYQQELRQLTRYQEYMAQITPWWAFSEAITRASTNGATMVTSYPPPAGLQTQSASLSSAASDAGSAPSTGLEDWLCNTRVAHRNPDVHRPTSGARVSRPLIGRINYGCSGGAGAGAAGGGGGGGGGLCNVAGVDVDEFFYEHPCEAFRRKDAGHTTNNPFPGDEAWNKEMLYNISQQQNNSEADAALPYYAQAAVLPNNFATGVVGGYTLCLLGFDGRLSVHHNQNPQTEIAAKVPYFEQAYATPYALSIPTIHAPGRGLNQDQSARMCMSNIIFGYHDAIGALKQDDGTTYRGRLDFMSADYTDGGTPDEAKGTGLWTLSRAEVMPVGDDTKSGNWHAIWTARVRPVARPQELAGLAAELNMTTDRFLYSAFNDSIDHFSTNRSIVHGGSENTSVWATDFKNASRAIRAIDNSTSGGMWK